MDNEKPLKEASDFLQKGVLLEADILDEGNKIREASKLIYPSELMDARLVCLSILRYLQEIKSGIPGKSDENISERIVLIGVFCQGTNITESLISEGQYIKVAAVLKQDFEILTRLYEIKKDAHKEGRVPNVKHAPEGSQRLYGELNDVAHPSKFSIIKELIKSTKAGSTTAVSSIPKLLEMTARNLYELHIWLIFEVAREALVLAVDMYGREPDFEIALEWLNTAADMLIKVGFTLPDIKLKQ